jgi:hypothetical protein
VTAAQFEDAEGRALVEAIHQRKNRNTMSSAREVLDGIKAREARRQAMIEDGSYRVTQTRCNDPERCGIHFQHPQNVTVETSHHGSYTSHLEALADHSARLAAAVEAVLGIQDIRMDSEHGDPAFLLGWEAALEEVQARIERALQEGR